MTDDEFVAVFENCTLPLESFRHADHVKMAFLYLGRYPLLEAIRQFSCSLARFATAHGKTNLYNQTITWAYLLLIQERLARTGQPQTWAEFAAGNADLLDWNDNVLKKYYRDETLKSEIARGTFVFPDR
jgi:N-formylglutamate deformylase